MARTEFPRLIRRLIFETGRGVTTVGFPAGEGVSVGGWDGTARSTEATAFIPFGLSLWELSVKESVSQKADEDYAKRLETPDGTPTTEAAYIAATLRRFAKRAEWARERAGDGRWREVRAYGVDDIEAWLETAPVTHYWLSELLGLSPTGLVPAETWWRMWSAATTPALTPQVVTAGRTDAVNALTERLSGKPQVITIKGGSVDEVLAFVWATVRSLSADQAGPLAARAAWVDDVATWRVLREHSQPLLIAPLTSELATEMGTGGKHRIVVPILGAAPADITLPPLDSQLVSEILKSGGLYDRRAEESARIARMSLLAMRRHLAVKPELHQPQWARPPISRLARSYLLLGRWDSSAVGDRAGVEALAGASYDTVSEDVSSRLVDTDPLMSSAGSIVGLVSPFDAWLVLSRALTMDDLQRFRTLALAVFKETDPRRDLPTGEQWRVAVVACDRVHSGDLRQGIATALALLGGHGDFTVQGSSIKAHDWARSIVREALANAGADTSGRVWASLSDVLPLLAEAAPDEFLDAVKEGLRGDGSLLRRLFSDDESDPIFSPTSPHVYLLWALEGLAWSRDFFGQAVDLLAGLTEVDPGSKRNSNRPFGSLETIVCPWHPNTSVGVEGRLAAIDGLRTRHPSVAWRLMLSLLPRLHGISFPTHEPEFRDWKPQQVSVPIVEYVGFVDAIVARLLEDVGDSGDRWKELIHQVENLPPDSRATVLGALNSAADRSFSAKERDAIWESLSDVVARHREFADAPWAMPPQDVGRLDALAARFRPESALKRNEWLFMSHAPHVPDVKRGAGNWNAYHEAVSAARTKAAAEIVASVCDWQALRDYAVSFRQPDLLGAAVAEAVPTSYETELVGLLDSEEGREVALAFGYAETRFRQEGWTWIEKHLRISSSPRHTARLLRATRDYPRAWERADAEGVEVADMFWKEFVYWGLGGDIPYIEQAARRLLSVGRAAATLDFLGLYMERGLDPGRAGAAYAGLIVDALESLAGLTEPDPEAGLLYQHDLVETFGYLARAGLPEERLARLEWLYLGALGYDARPIALARAMATDPNLFAEVVARVYRPRGARIGGRESIETEEASAVEAAGEDNKTSAAVAENAYRLLSQWKTVPGLRQDGSLDATNLEGWLARAREKLKELNRAEVGDVHIGHMLVWTPADNDGTWPSRTVRELLEKYQSDEIESGLQSELLSSRGVTSRSPFAGGAQELELVKRYRDQAVRFVDQWPRTAAILRAVADGYDRQATFQDERAERVHRGLG